MIIKLENPFTSSLGTRQTVDGYANYACLVGTGDLLLKDMTDLGGLQRANRLRECIRTGVEVLRAMSTPKFDPIRSQQIHSKLEELAILYRPLGIDLHSWLWEYYEQQARHSPQEDHPLTATTEPSSIAATTMPFGTQIPASRQDEDAARLMATMFRLGGDGPRRKSKRRNMALEEVNPMAQLQFLDYCDQILERMENRVEEQQQLLLQGQLASAAGEINGLDDDGKPILLAEYSRVSRQPIGTLLHDGGPGGGGSGSGGSSGDSKQRKPFDPLVESIYMVWDKPKFLTAPQPASTSPVLLRDREAGLSRRACRRIQQQLVRRLAPVHDFNESSGAVTQVRMCRTPFGDRLVTASTTCASTAYNRPGSLTVLDMQTLQCSILSDAHTVSVSRVQEDSSGGAEFQTIPHPAASEQQLTGRGSSSDRRFSATVSDVHFTADGRYLLSAGYDGGCTLWSAATLKPLKSFYSTTHSDRGFVYQHSSDAGSENRGSNYIISSDNNRPANATYDRRGARSRRGRSPKFVAVPRVHLLAPHRTHSAVFASAQSDGSVWIWDWRTTAAQASVVPEAAAANATPSPKLFRCQQAGRGLFPLSLPARQQRQSDRQLFECTTLTFGRHESRHLLIYGRNSYSAFAKPAVQLYDTIHQSHTERYEDFHNDGLEVEVSCLDVSLDGRQLAVGSCGDGQLRLFDLRHLQKPTALMQTPELDMNCVALSPCQSYVAMCGSRTDVLVYDRRYFARPLHTLSHAAPLAIDPGWCTVGVLSLLWTNGAGGSQRDGEQYLVSGGADGCVRVWDVCQSAETAAVNCLASEEGAIISLCTFEEQPYLSNACAYHEDDLYWQLYGSADDGILSSSSGTTDNSNSIQQGRVDQEKMEANNDFKDNLSVPNYGPVGDLSSIAFGLDTGRVYLYSFSAG